MNIFEFTNYKDFVDFWVKKQPKAGHGQYKKIAEALQMSTVMVSQVFSSDRHLTAEQAYDLCQYIGFDSLEREYFLNLVNLERAGTHRLKAYHRENIKQLKEKSKDFKKLLPQDTELTEAEKAVFNSNWFYSAIRLATSLKTFQTIDAISERLDLDRALVTKVLNFLVQHGLCIKENEKYKMGPNRIHLEATSPYIKTRQVSWRVKGFEKMDNQNPDQLFFTGPMSISEKQYQVLREKLGVFIKDLSKSILSEEPEKLVCLNVDLFEI